jgi:hypothetical protein
MDPPMREVHGRRKGQKAQLPLTGRRRRAAFVQALYEIGARCVCRKPRPFDLVKESRTVGLDVCSSSF